MTKHSKTDAAQLVEGFLSEYACPNSGDWKRLIDAHPQHAGMIADAAILHGSSDAMLNVTEQFQSDDEIFNATISGVLSAVHRTPSAALEAAEKQVAATQGPKARQVAVDIGIGPHASLLSGVLIGRTLAPAPILSALGEKLGVPIAALSEVFQQNFTSAEVPAFKSPDGQPQVATEPWTWEQSVRALKLSDDETKRLITLSLEE